MMVVLLRRLRAHPDGRPAEAVLGSCDAAALDEARIVVTAGAGAGAYFPLVEELAQVLGGEVGVTRAAAQLGLGHPEREVGASGRRVAPRLYVACGASGSSEHLAGISADSRIIAINRDVRAPICQVASYALIGELGELLPQLLSALRSAP